jgi:hypothetical protein
MFSVSANIAVVIFRVNVVWGVGEVGSPYTKLTVGSVLDMKLLLNKIEAWSCYPIESDLVISQEDSESVSDFRWASEMMMQDVLVTMLLIKRGDKMFYQGVVL